MSNLPMIGKPTEREEELMEGLFDFVADWIQRHETERRELIAALFAILYVVFDKQTHCDLEGKLKEVDAFCYYMKEKILGTRYE